MPNSRTRSLDFSIVNLTTFHVRAFLPPCRREEVNEVYSTPLLELVYKAASVHRLYNDPQMVRLYCLELDCNDTSTIEDVFFYGCFLKFRCWVTGATVHFAQHKDRWLSRDLHLLLAEQLLEEGNRPQSREANGPGRDLPGMHHALAQWNSCASVLCWNLSTGLTPASAL